MVFLDEHIQRSHQSQLHTICVPINLSLEEMERVVITATLEKFDYNRSRVAEELGIGSRTLLRKLKKFGIPKSGTHADDSDTIAAPALDRPERDRKAAPAKPEVAAKKVHEPKQEPQRPAAITAPPTVRKQRPSLPARQSRNGSSPRQRIATEAAKQLKPANLEKMAATTELAS